MKMFQLMLLSTLDLLVLSDIASGNNRCPIQLYHSWSKVGPYCASFFSEPVTFGEAEMMCRAEHPNGHLISVHDETSMLALEILTGYGYTRTWIGAQRIPCTNAFMWNDGSKWNYNNWVPGEPNGSGDCVQINWNTPGKFDDTTCCSRRAYVCAFLFE